MNKTDDVLRDKYRHQDKDQADWTTTHFDRWLSWVEKKHKDGRFHLSVMIDWRMNMNHLNTTSCTISNTCFKFLLDSPQKKYLIHLVFFTITFISCFRWIKKIVQLSNNFDQLENTIHFLFIEICLDNKTEQTIND